MEQYESQSRHPSEELVHKIDLLLKDEPIHLDVYRNEWRILAIQGEQLEEIKHVFRWYNVEVPDEVEIEYHSEHATITGNNTVIPPADSVLIATYLGDEKLVYEIDLHEGNEPKIEKTNDEMRYRVSADEQNALISMVNTLLETAQRKD